MSRYDALVAQLDAAGADYRLIDHDPEGRTELVSELRGNDLSAAAKCMVVMVKLTKKSREHILAVVPGDRRVDFEAIKKLRNGIYAGMVEGAVAEQLSGCEVGTVLPFVRDDSLTLIVDPSLLEHDVIYFNAARLDRSIALNGSDYVRVASPLIRTIASPL